MRKMEDISVVINARVNSTRLHHKLIRKFYGDLTLLDLALEKLSKLDVPNKYLAACEDEILEIYKKYKNNVKLILREKPSVESKLKDEKIIFAHYAKIDTPFIMSINPCMPFTKNKTYLRAIKEFSLNNTKSTTSVLKKNNIFFDKTCAPINVLGSIITTQNNPEIYEMAHSFHIFNKNYFLKNGKLWDYSQNNPSLFEIGKEECLDIDDEWDFNMIKCFYKFNSGTNL